MENKNKFKDFFEIICEYPFVTFFLLMVFSGIIGSCQETICIYNHGNWNGDACQFDINCE